MIGCWVLIVLAAVLLLREIYFRAMFIYPRVDKDGRFAARIEQRDLPRWVVPNTLQKKNDILFVGTSRTMDSINPALVTRVLGKSAFNFAFYTTDPVDFLPFLSQYQVQPEVMVFEVDFFYHKDGMRSKLDAWLQEHAQPTSARKFKNKLLNFNDRLARFLPSLCMGSSYASLLMRSFQSVRRLIKRGTFPYARYTPLQPFTSFNWHVEKNTNYRYVYKRKEKTLQELSYEFAHAAFWKAEFIAHSKKPIPQSYYQTMEERLLQFKNKGVKICLARYPMNLELDETGRKYFADYFKHIQEIAARNGFGFIDLGAMKDVEVYLDGLHPYGKDTPKITERLIEEIEKIYESK